MLKKLVVDDTGAVKPWVLYALSAVVVVGGGYAVYAAWTGGDAPLQSTLMCKDCAKTERRALEVGEEFPQKCPHCGKNSLLPAFRCSKCQGPNIYNEDRGLAPPTKCTHCGQENRHGS